ncbi:MAG: hypothetical protein RL748_1270, partial [Pseudomonadota bacterium]
MSIVLNLLNILENRGIKLDLNNDENLVINGDKRALDQTLINTIKAEKQKIVDYLLQKKKKLADSVISVIDRENTPLLLSFAQQRLWLLDHIDGGSAHYNMSGTLRLSGAINHDALNRAYTSVLERHESLRTNFCIGNDGQPLQVVQPSMPFLVPITDLSALQEDERQRQITRLIAEEAGREFNLSQDLMLRTSLLKLAADEHILLVTMHHIASDGWSMAILINEVSALYRAYVQGRKNPLSPLAIQYIDYAHWQRTWLQGEVLDQQLEYWATQLNKLPAVHGLPLDYPRPKVQTFIGNTYHTYLDGVTFQALNALCQANGATLFMGLHAAFSVLLARYSNETDIVIGSPIANREQPEVAGLIGFFVNTLVLRCDLSDNPDFITLLQQSKRMLMGAYEHQQVPFEQIVERLQPQRSRNHSALFQIMLVLQNNQAGVLALPGLSASAIDPDGSIAKYDLTLNIVDTAQGLQLGWNYNTDLFEATTIERMAAHFAIVLQSLTQAPGQSVFQATMLSAAEQHQLLVEWNDTASDYPHEQCIHHLFEQQVEKNPDAVALVCNHQQLTYRELNQRANQLAHYLIEHKQVKPDTLVGICLERSLEMVVGILGILKAGAAYVPLDPDYPAARLAYMVADAKLTTILTQRHVCRTSLNNDVHAVCLDAELVQQQCRAQAVTNIPASQIGLQSHHLAYLIYTSGSTGNPKGVMVAHRNTVAFLSWALVTYDQQQLRCVLASTSVCFDLSIFEMFAPLSVGGTALIVKNILELHPDLSEPNITLINTVPSAMEALLAGNRIPKSVTTVNLAGEPLKQKIVDSLYSKGINAVYDLYGPSEDTTYSTYVLRTFRGVASIGKPIHNSQVYVLNPLGQLVPVHTAGELYIGGAGLARGYLNRPELTAEKFIANPFYDKTNPASSERLYRTGDLVRWRHDGNLEFLGRIDHQVKIRGFRIELGEIEQALASHPQVKDALVLAKESASGDKRLLAYVVSAGVATEQLRQHLAQTLPDYMIPAVFVLLERFPLTPNGKVDRKALPEPDTSASQAHHVAPRTDMEHALCALWQEVLGVERVGITDDFFRLGGHSLSATRLMARINQTFNVALPLKTLFHCPTLGELAQTLLLGDAGLGRPALVPVSRAQTLLPSYAQQRLWLLDQIDGGSAHYNMSGGIRLTGHLNYAALDQAFTSIIERHQSLRTCFTNGDDGQVQQVIQAATSLVVPFLDFSGTMPGERQLQLAEQITDEASRAFDLSRDMMLRAQLIKLAQDEHVLLVTMHHIASDGWSMAILMNEFSALYQAYVQGQANPLPPLAIQYADYAHWQRTWLQGEVLDQQLSYWTGQLANLPLVHSVPLDHARPKVQTFNGETYHSQIEVPTRDALNALCQSSGATLFMGLHAVFSVLLARYSNETDIVLGSPIANREQAEVAGLIGFFVNTLVLRSDLSGNPSFSTLLEQSKRLLLDAYAHQQVPFDQIVER